ncbi:urease accessory protein D [Aristolochia californica]|uniref:urease accessory protein D n=1 Tax=Aristolochia californica TaxID=171875 RepID=UPI0035E38562
MENQDTGFVEVERIRGKSTVTRCFSKYPLKFIVPTKVGPSSTDAVWIYSISYGGGIVSGDCISCGISVGEGCTVVLTTQASTKVYKSVGSKCSEQYVEARIGKNALLVVIPDPVTCFSTARYCQKQVFRSFPDSNLVLVDWLTSGRYENGEKWEFDFYRSTNHIFLDGDQPIFLDSTLLEQGPITSIAERMQDYHVIAMVVLVGKKLNHVKDLVQELVKEMMSEQLYAPKSVISGPHKKIKFMHSPPRPALIASCSSFGPKGIGMVVRIAAETTEAVYQFLRDSLGILEPLLGVAPYCS